MRNKLIIVITLGILFQIIIGCSTKWTQVIQFGEIAKKEFRETIDIEINNDLIFVPVTIKGKEYRFLFDTGAPFSISEQLQRENNFKIVSKGTIVDSDRNSKKVNWSQVDSICIGKLSFLNHAAFVGDFKANPILSCLEIDGIIGSNLIRNSNWTIDQEQNSLSMHNSIEADDIKGSTSISFKTDKQYNMFIDINIASATLRKVLVDYGSSGSISLNDEIFKTIKSKNIIGETWFEKGKRQSGIVGKRVDLSREFTYSDSVCLASNQLKSVMLRTGKTTSIGNKILSNFRVTIDWNIRKLHLIDSGKTPDPIRFSGFKLGYSADLGVHVQSVVENSNAYISGVRPNMKVMKLDSLNFESENDFCDYVRYKSENNIFIELIDSTGHKIEYHFEKTNI